MAQPHTASDIGAVCFPMSLRYVSQVCYALQQTLILFIHHICGPTRAIIRSFGMTATTSQTILASLRGQSIRLCDLNVLFTGWPRGINPHLGRLRKAVDDWLEWYGGPSASTDRRTLSLTLNLIPAVPCLRAPLSGC